MIQSRLSQLIDFRRMDLRHPLLWCPALKLLVHIATLAGYGVFRDELYYLACSDRPAAGYVDHPPLSIWILRLARGILGEGPAPMRTVAAWAGAASVLAVGLTARRLGAGRWGQGAAMTAFMAVPVFWFTGHVYSMNAFEPLIWALVGLLWLGGVPESRGVQDPPPWILLGIVLGLGLLNKVSVLWLGAGLGVALLAGRERRFLMTRGPWLCGALSMFLWLPFLWWQAAHGWPMIEFMRNASEGKMQSVSGPELLFKQLDMLGPIVAPAMFIGAYGLVRAGARERGLVWMYGTVLTILWLNGSSRASYLAPAYTWLAGAFGTWIETSLRHGTRRSAVVLRWSVVALLALQGVLLLPLALPILPVDTYVRYAAALGVEPGTEERKAVGRLPQHYADMFGWKEKVSTARRVLESLPAGDREKVCFAAQNYGVAGALEREDWLIPAEPGGKAKWPLPPVLSGHNSYYFWRPAACSGEILIIFGDDEETLSAIFGFVEQVDTVRCAPCMPYEDEQPVWLVREPLVPLQQIWPQVKNFN